MVRSHGRRSGISKVDEFDAESVTTDTLDITNETNVEAFVSSDQSFSAGIHTVNFDSEVADSRDEYNPSTNEFVPDRTADYRVEARVKLSQSGSSDDIQLILRDTDALNNVIDVERAKSPDSNNRDTLVISDTIELSAGTTYRPQVANDNSSDTVLSGKNHSHMSIKEDPHA